MRRLWLLVLWAVLGQALAVVDVGVGFMSGRVPLGSQGELMGLAYYGGFHFWLLQVAPGTTVRARLGGYLLPEGPGGGARLVPAMDVFVDYPAGRNLGARVGFGFVEFQNGYDRAQGFTGVLGGRWEFFRLEVRPFTVMNPRTFGGGWGFFVTAGVGL